MTFRTMLPIVAVRYTGDPVPLETAFGPIQSVWAGARLPSQILADHIALCESMRAQISEAPDCERKPLDLARLDGAIASLRMAKTAIEASSSLTSAPESAALSETPPAATERPVGLAWLADTVPGGR